MSTEIIGLGEWLDTPPGRYLREWEQAQFDAAVADVFGYHALQLGMPEYQTLKSNRMPRRWLASPRPGPRVNLQAEFEALPFAANSLDLLTLPHTLELSADPHGALREVERVLVPEGRVIICGFNPVSLWGLRQRRANLYKRVGIGELYLPAPGEFINYWRLRDWLRLLSFEVESSQFGLYRPSVSSQAWLERLRWFDTLGKRWWPIFGSAYFIVAVKRVRGMRVLPATWKRGPAIVAAPVPLARRTHPLHRVHNNPPHQKEQQS